MVSFSAVNTVKFMPSLFSANKTPKYPSNAVNFPLHRTKLAESSSLAMTYRKPRALSAKISKSLNLVSKVVKIPSYPTKLARSSSLAVTCSKLRALSTKTSESSDLVSDSRKSTNPIVVIDNYDSFTYNLCQYIGELGFEFEVYRNDELTLDELKRKNPRGILISPGPGAPQDSGISLQTVLELGPTVPLFGVCMGLQCIGEAFGGKIVRSPYGVMHGKSSLVYYNEGDQDGLFSGLSKYHSLVIEKDSFPSDVLEMTAWTEDGLIMAARHKTYKYLQGVQFHPESIITTEGKMIVHNFIKLIERKELECPN